MVKSNEKYPFIPGISATLSDIGRSGVLGGYTNSIGYLWVIIWLILYHSKKWVNNVVMHSLHVNHWANLFLLFPRLHISFNIKAILTYNLAHPEKYPRINLKIVASPCLMPETLRIVRYFRNTSPFHSMSSRFLYLHQRITSKSYRCHQLKALWPLLRLCKELRICMSKRLKICTMTLMTTLLPWELIV